MKKPDYPQQLSINTYLMATPFVSSFNNEVANNPLADNKVKINYNRAFNQWLKVYRFLAERGLVYVLPNEGDFQDQIYVANLGLVIHNAKKPTVLISNFTSPPRRGEDIPGRHFFSMMKYRCIHSPFHFEGEADCKYIGNNTYIGGYGIRSDIRVYEWMQKTLDCRVIPIQMYDKKLYHWDTIFFPIDEENAVVNTSVLADSDVDLIGKYINIIPVPKSLKYTGITNLCRNGSIILCRDLEPAGKKWLGEVCNQHGYEVVYFPLEEFDSSGADLSCIIMHMNQPELSVGKSVNASISNFLRKGS